MTLRNRKIVGWKIWYGDNTTVSSKEMTWIEAPQLNVQIVKIFYDSDNGLEFNIYKNQEYYLLGELYEVPKTIKLARGIDGDLFYELLEKATFDSEIIDSMKT